MAVLEYVTQFHSRILDMYGHELTSDALFHSNPDINIIGAKNIKLPRISVSGYKDHDRNMLGFNGGNYSNSFETKELDHDRDIEFFIDPMDVDETNQILSIANIQARFEKRQAIPELDCYTYSKLYTEAQRVGAQIKTAAVTRANILADFDDNCEKFEDAGVPLSRCILYCTAAYKKELKNAEGIQRTLSVDGGTNGIDRRVHSMDDLGEIKVVPIERFKTAYDFTEGYKADASGKQINYILVDPEAQVSRVKYSYINTYTPGHDSRTADKYLYQNRRFNGTFALDQELKKACIINVEA
ncbi:capsid protein [Enterococcus sp. AZ109]|uniref:capsid protein n=1 Tax=Enterococcus sp. AZ109 TaxID=2774634 RepID=UPI003F22B484